MVHRRRLAYLTLAALVCVGLLLGRSSIQRWEREMRDLARARGSLVGEVYDSTSVPELDWRHPSRRSTLWRALRAPDRALPVDPDAIRLAASFFLVETARSDDVPKVVALACEGRIEPRIAALHVAKSWLDEPDPEPVPPLAVELLQGAPEEQALASLALCIYTGHRIEDVSRVAGSKSTLADLLDLDWSPHFGISRTGLAADWLEWTQDPAATSLAELHALALARHAYLPRGSRWIERLLHCDGAADWRRAVGLPTEPQSDPSLLQQREVLSALLEHQVALDGDAVATAFHLSWPAPRWCSWGGVIPARTCGTAP